MAKHERLKYLCEVGIIAALYAVLTIAVAPIAYGPFQCRISEALCILPFFTPAAVPGLFIGCAAANAFGMVAGSSLGLLDVVVGSLATLFAAWAASKIRVKWLVPMPAVVVNMFAVPIVLQIMLQAPYWLSALWVGLGQMAACYGIGLPLLLILQKSRKVIFNRGA